jgi:hypothetical protein
MQQQNRTKKLRINSIPPEMIALISSRLSHKNKIRLASTSKHMHKSVNQVPLNPLPTMRNVEECQPSMRDVARCAVIIGKLYACLKTLATPFAGIRNPSWRFRYKFIRDHFKAHFSRVKFKFYNEHYDVVPLNSIPNNLSINDDHDPPSMYIICCVDSTREINFGITLNDSKVKPTFVNFEGRGASVEVERNFGNQVDPVYGWGLVNLDSVHKLLPMHFWRRSSVLINPDAPQGIVGIRLALADVLLWVAALNSAFHNRQIPKVRFEPAKVALPLRRLFRAIGLLEP